MKSFKQFLLEFSPSDLHNYSEKLSPSQILEKVNGQEFSAWLFEENGKTKTLFCTDAQRHKELCDSYLENVLEDYELKDELTNKDKEHIKEINQIFRYRGFVFYDYMFRRNGLRIGCNAYDYTPKTLYFQIDTSPEKISKQNKDFIIKALHKWNAKDRATLDYTDKNNKLQFITGKDKIIKAVGGDLTPSDSNNKLGPYGQFRKDHPYNRFDESKDLEKEILISGYDFFEELNDYQNSKKYYSGWIFEEDGKIKILRINKQYEHAQIAIKYIQDYYDESLEDDNRAYNYMFRIVNAVRFGINKTDNNERELFFQYKDFKNVPQIVKDYMFNLIEDWDEKIFFELGMSRGGIDKEEALHIINPSYTKKYISSLKQFRESEEEDSKQHLISADDFFKELFNHPKNDYSGWIFLENNKIKIIRDTCSQIHYYIADQFLRYNYNGNIDIESVTNDGGIYDFMFNTLKAVRFGVNRIKNKVDKELFFDYKDLNDVPQKVKDYIFDLVSEWKGQVYLDFSGKSDFSSFSAIQGKEEVLKTINPSYTKKYVSPLNQFRESNEDNSYKQDKISGDKFVKELSNNPKNVYSGWIFVEDDKVQVLRDKYSGIHYSIAEQFIKHNYKDVAKTLANDALQTYSFMFKTVKAVRFGVTDSTVSKTKKELFFHYEDLNDVPQKVKDYIFDLVSDWKGLVYLDFSSVKGKEEVLKIFKPSYNKKYVSPLAQFRESFLSESLTETQEELYKKWKELVNMSSKELTDFYASEEGKKAGLTREEASANGIRRGRDSAKAIIRMKERPKEEWSYNDWNWAKHQISFISRMANSKGPLWKDGVKTRKHLSLLIWGHNPEKK